MLYAKVVLGLPVEGPFDYSFDPRADKRISEGFRVWVEFGSRKKLGYVVGVSTKTRIKRVKPILEIIDKTPAVNQNVLSLTAKLSEYYACSWGEAIEAALPDALRKGRPVENNTAAVVDTRNRRAQESLLIHDLNSGARWDIYLSRIKETLGTNRSVIALFPDINSVLKARDTIAARLGITPVILYRKQPNELENWLKAKNSNFNCIIGTRSGIFAPVNNLGLVIIDEEEEPVYKQDQVPHYHARQIAFMRCRIEKAALILGSGSPSLESFYLAKKEEIKYMLLPREKSLPQVKVVDNKAEFNRFKQTGVILTKYLQDCIAQALDSKGKTLLFLNRHGFATSASCRNCQAILKCPRCDISLIYHYKDNVLSCRYCNFKMDPPKICPHCNAAYIRYQGSGIEKLESEVSRCFPQARVVRSDSPVDIDNADILISTASIIKQAHRCFDLTGVLSIDNSLNRVDLRSTEKIFGLLTGLLMLTDKKMVIQTNAANHYSLQAIINNNAGIFYDEELRQRKQLKFPPFSHLCLVKLRSSRESIVREASGILFEDLSKRALGNKSIKVLSLNRGQPEKLRGNFYWQILLESGSPLKMVKFLKLHLKNFRHSGIIVTVDVDPI